MRYNLLTLQLLYEGYSAEMYPDYVRIPTGMLPGDNPLNNIYGGFEFVKAYLDTMVFKTPCGKFVLGRNVIDNMHFHISWQAENFNPVIKCPYAFKRDFSCDLMHPLLKENRAHAGSYSKMQFCSCGLSYEEYEYENSIEKAEKEKLLHMEKRYEEFSQRKKGHVCRNHARFDENTDEWKMSYSPERCASVCTYQYCPVRGKELSKKKANVYYDLYTKTVHEDGLLNWETEKIQKGIRYFDTAVSRDICEDFVRIESGEIERNYRLNHGRSLAFGKGPMFEIRNIRVEARPSRNLLEDLRDIDEGRFVSFAPEDEKKKKEEKKAKRKQAAEKRLVRLEKKIVSNGFDNLTEGDKYRAEKLLSCERIDELDAQYQEEKSKPVMIPLSLFDF